MTIQYQQVYLCSTQENTLGLPNICKSTCVLLRRTLYNSPISASLLVFPQENTLQLPNICKSTCVPIAENFTTSKYLQVYLYSSQENTLQLSNICMSTCVLLRRTLYIFQDNYDPSIAFGYLSSDQIGLEPDTIKRVCCEAQCGQSFFQTSVGCPCCCFLAEMGKIPCCGRPESSSSNI